MADKTGPIRFHLQIPSRAGRISLADQQITDRRLFAMYPKIDYPFRRLPPSASTLLILLSTVSGYCQPVAGDQPKSAGPQAGQSSSRPNLVTQIGSKGPIVAVMNDDASRIVTTSEQGAVVWDGVSGLELRRLKGHTDRVLALAMSKEGRWTITGSEDGTARLWETSTGRQLRQFPPKVPGQAGDRDGVWRVAVSPDGRTLATGYSSGMVRLWDMETGAEHGAFQAASSMIRGLEFSPIGDRILTSGFFQESPRISLWEAATRRLLRDFRLKAPRSAMGLAFGQDGKHAYACQEHEVWEWDLDNGAEVLVNGGRSKDTIMAVAVTPDGRNLVSGDASGNLSVWDIATGRPVSAMPKQPDIIRSIQVSPDGRKILIGADDSPARLFDLGTGRELVALAGRAEEVTGLAASRDGRFVAVGGKSGSVTIWDLTAGRATRLPSGQADQLVCLDFSRDDRHLLTGSLNGTVKVWEVDTWRELRQITFSPGQELKSKIATFSADGKYVLITGIIHNIVVGEKTPVLIKMYEISTGNEVRSFTKEFVLDLVKFNPEIAVVSGDGARSVIFMLHEQSFIWNVATGQVVGRLDRTIGWPTAAAVSPDDRLVFAADGSLGMDNTIGAWGFMNGELMRRYQGHTERVMDLAVSPDGTRLLSGSGDGTARLWDVASGKSLRSLASDGPVHFVAFGAAGKAVTASGEGEVHLWDADRGDRLCTLVAFRDGGWAVADTQGRYDASNGGDVDGLHWVVGDEAIGLAQFKARYYDPGLLAKHLGFSKEPLRGVAALSGVKSHPSVQVAAPNVADPRGILGITLTDRGGGVGRVAVKINGKEVITDARRLGSGAAPLPGVVRLSVPLAGDPRLVPGSANAVEVVAYNADGSLRSRGTEVVYMAGGPRPKSEPELWAVVVGTADYIGKEIDLRFADRDAEAFSRALSVAAGRLLGEGRVHIRTLSTAQPHVADRPTKANIEAAFGSLARSARPTDILVVYLSGHGVAPPGEDEYYYLTADARSLELSDPEVRRRDAVSASELAELIRAVPATERQVLVLDTCAAGRGIEALGQRRAVSGDQVRALERVKDRSGLHLLAGSAADAASYETSRYGQGLLTYSLLEGMTGPGLKGTELDVLTWFGYAVDEVPQLAKGIGGVQRPLLSSPRGGASFPLGRLEPEDRARLPLAKLRPLVLRSSIVGRETFDDDLGLGGRVDELMRGAWAKGEGTGPVFVDQRQGDGAYRLAGGYRVEGEAVEVEVNVFRGRDRVGRVSVRGSTKDLDALARAIASEVDKLFLP